MKTLTWEFPGNYQKLAILSQISYHLILLTPPPELPEPFTDGRVTLLDPEDEVKFTGIQPAKSGTVTIKVKYGFPGEPPEAGAKVR